MFDSPDSTGTDRDRLERESYPVRGLERPVEIVEDRYGVPHLYAASQQDAFRAQGFNAARARLFQIDLWRRRGLGQLAEVLGPDYVERDRAARLFLYRGDMDEEWSRYAPDARGIAERFVEGINAYVDLIDERPDLLPDEFRVLGHRPARWSAEDVVRIRSHGLTRNVTSEVARARVARVAGVEADRVRQGLEPEWSTTIPDGFDPDLLPEDVLDVFDLATRDVEFDSVSVHSRQKRAGASDPGGSNNWVVSGKRTDTGRPILANDPHRGYSVPGLRYIAHLSAPGMDVIGAGEPALPGISIGHNGTIAFGMTIFPLDQEDLYVYDLDPHEHTRYRYGDEWESMSVLGEQIVVRGESAREVELWFTRHGPVLCTDSNNHRAYALRTAWLEPGTAPYFGSVGYMRAGDAAEFVAVMRNWGAPTENQVYADVSGTIGWVPGGLAPRRVGYDGLLPVPGDGRYEWDGFYSGDDLPRVFDPERGFLASANQMNLPDGDSGRKLGFEWHYPFRYQRIVEVLERTEQHSVRDAELLQNDQLSLPARHLIALLGDIPAPRDDSDSELARALRLLRTWDCVESADSAAAALFEVWLTRHLGPAFVREVVPSAAELVESADLVVLLEEMHVPGRWLSGVEARERLLRETLRSAYREVRELLGDEEERWAWGSLLRSEFRHPASAALPPGERERFDVGPFPRGGSADTVNQSAYETAGFVSFGGSRSEFTGSGRPDSGLFRHSAGPSFRMILDVGNWEASRAVNVPGQSGNVADRHYRDLVDLWEGGDYFPLAYSESAVEEIASRRIVLKPAE